MTHDEHEVRSTDAARSRGTALAVAALLVLLVATATLGWRHYRSADPSDPLVEILPATPTSADAGGA